MLGGVLFMTNEASIIKASPEPKKTTAYCILPAAFSHIQYAYTP